MEGLPIEAMVRSGRDLKGPEVGGTVRRSRSAVEIGHEARACRREGAPADRWG